MTTLSIERGIVTKNFGGDGGDGFDPLFVKRLALRGGDVVDAIIINGEHYGGDGGHQSDTLHFDADEYITEVYIHTGDLVDYLRFVTNHGRDVSIGGEGGDNHYELKNVRVIAIGGSRGSLLDRIDITYVDNYEPSKIVQRRAQFVIGFTSPDTTLREYADSLYKTTDSYQKITETMLDQTYSASIEAEYYAKVAMSTTIRYQNISKTTVFHELSEELRTGISTEKKVGPEQVGVLLTNGDILCGSNGKTWMFPTTPLSYAVISIDAYQNVLNHYDLTGELATQMPGLRNHKTEKDGYVFYSNWLD